MLLCFAKNSAHLRVQFATKFRGRPKAAQGAPGRPKGFQSMANGSQRAFQRDPKGDKREPIDTMVPQLAQRDPTSAPGRPKGPQRTANGSPRAPQRDPKGVQGRPKGSQRHPKDTQGKPKGQYIFTNSRSIAPADVMIFKQNL